MLDQAQIISHTGLTYWPKETRAINFRNVRYIKYTSDNE
jgi:hypothetical protein